VTNDLEYFQLMINVIKLAGNSTKLKISIKL